MLLDRCTRDQVRKKVGPEECGASTLEPGDLERNCEIRCFKHEQISQLVCHYFGTIFRGNSDLSRHEKQASFREGVNRINFCCSINSSRQLGNECLETTRKTWVEASTWRASKKTRLQPHRSHRDETDVPALFFFFFLRCLRCHRAVLSRPMRWTDLDLASTMSSRICRASYSVTQKSDDLEVKFGEGSEVWRFEKKRSLVENLSSNRVQR